MLDPSGAGRLASSIRKLSSTFSPLEGSCADFTRRLVAVGRRRPGRSSPPHPTAAQAHPERLIRQGRLLHPVGHLRPRLPARQGAELRRGRPADPPQLRVRRRSPRTVSAPRPTRGPTGRRRSRADEQRRRRRRRGRPADRRQPQPARRAQDEEPRAAGPDLARRLDAVGVLLRRRPDRRLPQEARQLLPRPVDQGQPARAGRRASPPASSTASTSTGSGPAPTATPATSSGPRTSRTSPCSPPSSAGQLDKLGRNDPQALRPDRVPAGRARRRSTPASRPRRSSSTSTSAPCRATTSTAPGRRGPTSSPRCGCRPGAPDNPDFSVEVTINAWLDRGAPQRKLVLGIPYYGQGWTGVTGGGNGLFAPATGAGAGHLRGRHRGLQDAQEPARAGLHACTATAAGHSWLFDGTTFWTYDDPAQIAAEDGVHPGRGPRRRDDVVARRRRRERVADQDDLGRSLVALDRSACGGGVPFGAPPAPFGARVIRSTRDAETSSA